ncbi:unnamed protein product, partial [Bubo scandiacus]
KNYNHILCRLHKQAGLLLRAHIKVNLQQQHNNNNNNKNDSNNNEQIKLSTDTVVR